MEIITRSPILGHLTVCGRRVGERRWRVIVPRKRNLITTQGRTIIAELLLGRFVEPTAIAVGLDDTAPDLTDTTLADEFFRKIITRRYSASRKAFMQMLMLETEANGAGSDFVEAGLFSSVTADTEGCYSRITFDGVPKDSGILYTWTWEWEIVEE